MGQRKHGGVSKEHAINQLIVEECNNYEKYRRESDIADSKELMDYEAKMMKISQGQPLVIFQSNSNMNINLNIDINNEMSPERLQEIFNVISANMI